MITIILNGEPRKLAEELDLESLIEHFSLPHKRIAVELNNNVISRSEWGAVKVNDGDKLEVVHFVGGG